MTCWDAFNASVSSPPHNETSVDVARANEIKEMLLRSGGGDTAFSIQTV